MGNAPNGLGEYIASAPLTSLVKPGGDGLQFGVGVTGGNEAILHSVNRLIEACGMMLVFDVVGGFQERIQLGRSRDCIMGSTPYGRAKECSRVIPLALCFFSLVLHPLICKIRDSFSLSLHAWYLDDDTIVGDTIVVGMVLELIMDDGPRCGLHLNVDKTEVFWPKEDPRSRLAGISPPNIAQPLHGVKLLGGSASVDFDFFVFPGYTLLCSHALPVSAQRSFDVALRSSLERIVTASGPGFGDWQ
nr:hypothetical protein [Tanacetum cinerariifolium]